MSELLVESVGTLGASAFGVEFQQQSGLDFGATGRNFQLNEAVPEGDRGLQKGSPLHPPLSL